jgi:hypothetical protein
VVVPYLIIQAKCRRHSPFLLYVASARHITRRPQRPVATGVFPLVQQHFSQDRILHNKGARPMKPVPVEKPRFRQDRAAKMHDAEMAVQLSDLGKTSTVGNRTQTPTPPGPSPELLNELYSAASMIMSREECEALLKQVDLPKRSRPVAA